MSIIDTIYTWVRNLSFFAVLSTAVLQMIPDHGFQKYVRFFTGLLMVSMLILPILQITGKKDIFTEIYESREYRDQIEESNEKRQNLMEQIKVLEKNMDETGQVKESEESLNAADIKAANETSADKTTAKGEEKSIENNNRIEVEQIEIGKSGNSVLEE